VAIVSARDLIAQADAALYQAKRQGRNCVCVAPTAGPEKGSG
jgi:PleD family two-component response regulator